MIKNERLKLIADSVREGVTVCDVGTDHAIIPVELILSRRTPKCIITDISAPSLEKGVENAKKTGVIDAVESYCTNGTLGVKLDSRMDFIIAGMGGELIAEILEQDERLKSPEHRFILQPMSKAEVLREYLAKSGFEVVKEEKVKASARLYSVITCVYDGKQRTVKEKDILLGYFADANSALDIEYAKRLLKSLEVKLKGLELASSSGEIEISELKQSVKTVEEFLNK